MNIQCHIALYLSHIEYDVDSEDILLVSNIP